MCDDHHDILDGTGEEILDCHPPHPSPPCPLEAISGGSAKGSLREVLAGLYVSFSFPACGMPEHSVQLVLSYMSLEGAPLFRAGARVSELTGGADAGRGLVFIVVALFIVASSFEQMPCRTAKDITASIIDKGLFGKDPLLST